MSFSNWKQNTQISYPYVPLGPQNTDSTKQYYSPAPEFSDLSMQPLIFTNQIYPKIPWYPKTNMPCGSGCGATGKCGPKGLCEIRPSNGTVFSGDVTYIPKKNPSIIEAFGDPKKRPGGF